MAEENIATVVQEEPANAADDYVARLRELQNTTVSRKEFDRVEAERKKLADALATVDLRKPQKEEPTAPDMKELYKRFNEAKNDLELLTASIEIRDAVLAEGGRDPWLPTSPKYTPSYSDEKDIEDTVEGIKACIERADGDPKIFSAELSNRCGGYKPQRKTR